MFGPCILQNWLATVLEYSNRSLLFELCVAIRLAAANTCFPLAADNLVTCYHVGFSAMDDFWCRSHGQIDVVLGPKKRVHYM